MRLFCKSRLVHVSRLAGVLARLQDAPCRSPDGRLGVVGYSVLGAVLSVLRVGICRQLEPSSVACDHERPSAGQTADRLMLLLLFWEPLLCLCLHAALFGSEMHCLAHLCPCQ